MSIIRTDGCDALILQSSAVNEAPRTKSFKHALTDTPLSNLVLLLKMWIDCMIEERTDVPKDISLDSRSSAVTST